MSNNNLVPPVHHVHCSDREKESGHKSFVIWFTGLSGSGKSTLAMALEKRLHDRGCRTFVLDGDNVRGGLCSDLGFSRDDREENIRRISEVSSLFVDAGVIVLTSFISPFVKDREVARRLVGSGRFIEVFCAASLECCEKRDVKGLYKKARSGEVLEFTGISSPYEVPSAAEIEMDTSGLTTEECVLELLAYLQRENLI